MLKGEFDISKGFENIILTPEQRVIFESGDSEKIEAEIRRLNRKIEELQKASIDVKAIISVLSDFDRK